MGLEPTTTGITTRSKQDFSLLIAISKNDINHIKHKLSKNAYLFALINIPRY